MKLEHNDHLTLHLGWAGKETLKSSLQESVLLFIYLFHLFLLHGGQLLYNIVVVFAIR